MRLKYLLDLKNGLISLLSSLLAFVTAVPPGLRGNANHRFTEKHRDSVLMPRERWIRRVESAVVIDSLVINKLHLARGGRRV